jgi:hypothetical protein
LCFAVLLEVIADIGGRHASGGAHDAVAGDCKTIAKAHALHLPIPSVLEAGGSSAAHGNQPVFGVVSQGVCGAGDRAAGQVAVGVITVGAVGRGCSGMPVLLELGAACFNSGRRQAVCRVFHLGNEQCAGDQQ